MNPTANNYLLPLRGEGNPIRDARIRVAVKLEPTLTFYELVDGPFFYAHFRSKTVRELRLLMRDNGLPCVGMTKIKMVAALSGHWTRHLKRITSYSKDWPA